MSSRVNVFQSFPRSGVPDVFGSWDEWASLIGHAQRAGVLKDHTYLWWDVRLAPAFGTVEIRIMDAQTSVHATTALTALVQACAATLGDWFDQGLALECPPTMLVEENKWRAARFGLDTAFVPYLDSDAEISAVDSTYALLDLVMPAAKRLGTVEQLSGVEGLIAQSGARRQLETYELTGDLASVVDQLVTDSIA
jgi:carboxylate-amine ligase